MDILPGMGYHSDKPLLYYLKKIMRSMKAQIIDVDYGPLPQNSKADLEYIARIAEASAKAALRRV